jgi:hypothetical protein
MPSPEVIKSSLGLDEVESLVRQVVGPIEAKGIESLVESMELREESTNLKFLGFEFQRVRRVWSLRRRCWARWVSILTVLAVTAAGVLKLLILN